MRKWLRSCLVVGVLIAALPQAAYAAQPTNKGLFVSPVRDYVATNPGVAIHKKIVVANITDTPVTITVSVEQFSVADFTYDYSFVEPKEDWITLSPAHFDLQPEKSQDVGYTLTPPANATPGGHYFTILVTATSQNTPNRVQAASLIYATVNGNLQISSVIQKVDVPRIAFSDIPFSLQVEDTGNTHFFIYVAGVLNGTLNQDKNVSSTHLLMPQAARQVGGTITAPLLPGVYTATYGYRTDSGQTVQESSHVLYMPLWFIALFVGFVWVTVVQLRRHRRRKRIKDF